MERHGAILHCHTREVHFVDNFCQHVGRILSFLTSDDEAECHHPQPITSPEMVEPMARSLFHDLRRFKRHGQTNWKNFCKIMLALNHCQRNQEREVVRSIQQRRRGPPKISTASDTRRVTSRTRSFPAFDLMRQHTTHGDNPFRSSRR